MHQQVNFLLVEHGGPRKKFTFEALKRKKLTIYLATETVPDWLSEYVDSTRIILTDTSNSIKLLADVVTFMEANDIEFQAIGTFCEYEVTQTADTARALGLNGLDPAAARKSSANKLLMRRSCRNAGIATPRFKVANLAESGQLEAAIQAVGVPCVVKPIIGQESYGTIKVEPNYNMQEILNEISLNTSADKHNAFRNFTGRVLVEQYLPGKVVSIDGIVQDKRIMFAGSIEYVMGPEPRFTQEANYIPARLQAVDEVACRDMATSIIEELGFDNCGFHCELRLTPDGPVLLEIAARLPGGPLQLGYKQAHGYDLTALIIDVWLGRSVTIQSDRKNFVLQKAVFPRQQGTLGRLTGAGEAGRIRGVWEFSEILHEGDKVVTYPDIPVPYYYYAISADSVAALDQLSEQVETAVVVELQ